MDINREQLNQLSADEKRKLLVQLMEQKESKLKILPLSFAQERLWFLDRLMVDSPAYNIPSVMQLKGQLNVPALEQSLKTLMERQESLRTTFSTNEGEPVQVIAPQGELNMQRVDLQYSSKDEKYREAQKQVALETAKPFDLSQGPLWRVILFVLGKEEYILFVNIHHIIFDGWSLGIFNRELGILYNAYCNNQSSPLDKLPKLPIQYGDFARWQREWLKGERLASQLSFWRNLLADVPPLEIPTDRMRPPIQTYQGGVLSVSIEPDLLHRLKVLSKQENVTLYMLLFAAFATLLHRYSQSTQLAIASPVANRDRPEIESLLGFFVNTLAIPIDFSGTPTFRQLLKQSAAVIKEGYNHQTLPFEKLVHELQPQRDLSRNPLVQVLFALQNVSIKAIEFNQLTVSPLKYDFAYTRFDLELHLWEESKVGIAQQETLGELSGTFFYNRDLFDRETIARLFHHFQTLLHSIISNPDAPVWQLQILPLEEQNLLLFPPKNHLELLTGGLHDEFTAQAEQTPDLTALIWENQAWTYAQLNQKANQLAHYLGQKGVQSGSIVALFLDRSPALVIAMIAVLKAGGAYVPIDINYPRDRLNHILVDSQFDLILTQTDLLTQLQDNESICCLDGEQSAIDCCSLKNPSIPVTRDSLLYIIYTSGSTGIPKGIAMNHGTLINLIQTQKDSLSGPAKTLQFASVGFDVATQEIFFTLCTGGTLYLIPDRIRRDPSVLLESIQKQGVERLFLPFAFLEQLAIEAQETDRFPIGLREVITAGEQLKITPAIAHFFDHLPQGQLINQYGPAETHVVTEFKLTGATETWPKLPPIGRPIPQVQVYILDEYLQPVPPGVLGEIYIGGVAPARGYHNRPDQTAQKFIPNPFAGGNRLYRSGDRGRYFANGNIEFMGRIDRQVKIRGYRIEPGEIEVMLNAHPGVQESVVVSTAAETSKRLLIAYFVPRTSSATSIELRTYLQKLLPDYMIPTYFVEIANLPLSPNGKVDIHTLPPPQELALPSEQPYVAPRTAVEITIATVWQEVLQLPQVSIYDNFFNLGGNSLLIVQVQRKLRKTFDRPLTVTDLFQYPTIYHLSNYIQSQSEKEKIGSSLGDRIQKQKQAIKRQSKLRRKNSHG